jgi:hypothetical protein
MAANGDLTAPQIPTVEIISAASVESAPVSAFSMTAVIDLGCAQHSHGKTWLMTLSIGAKVGIASQVLLCQSSPRG